MKKPRLQFKKDGVWIFAESHGKLASINLSQIALEKVQEGDKTGAWATLLNAIMDMQKK